MAGVLFLTMVFSSRRTPTRWESDRRGGDGPAWAYGASDSGGDRLAIAVGMAAVEAATGKWRRRRLAADRISECDCD
jgi:hypothetical protein